MHQDNVLHVAYASDDNYANLLGISLASLLKANTGFADIICHVLDCGIGEENKRRLASIAKSHQRTVEFYPMDDIEARLGLQGAAFRIAAASYARLFLPSLLPNQVDRLLYLDCDTIVAAPLDALWETPLDGVYIGGVQDTVDVYFQKIIGLAPELPYINAGLLLINLKAWRDDDLQSRFADFIRRFEGQVPHHDQGTINGVCAEKRLLLPLRYNMTSNLYSFSVHTIERIYFIKQYYSQKELDQALQSPAIVHFTSGLVGRPWEERCTHPERDRFLSAKADTPWASDPLAQFSLKLKTRVFAAFYRLAPRWLFETAYRMLGWVQHLKG